VVVLGVGILQPAAQYFGQNKVSTQLNFQSIQTEHFDLYYYRMSPRSGRRAHGRTRVPRLSRILHHQFSSRKPIILYACAVRLPADNVSTRRAKDFGGVHGVLQAPRRAAFHRLVRRSSMAAARDGHQFQYDVYSRGRAGAGSRRSWPHPPLWFIGGMAEYLSLHRSIPRRRCGSAMRPGGTLPSIEDMTDDPYIFPYR